MGALRNERVVDVDMYGSIGGEDQVICFEGLLGLVGFCILGWVCWIWEMVRW